MSLLEQSDASEDAAQAVAQTRPRIQSVARAAQILVAVARSDDGLTSKQIAELLGVSRQGAYHLIHTLTGVGLLARGERSRYVLGLSVGTLAAAFARQLAAPEQLAGHVRALAAATNETAYAAGWRESEIVVLTVARGSAPVQAMEVAAGTTEDGHARASGKLLLAFAPADVRERYLAGHPLRRRTSRTITTRKRLDAELAQIRELGYAVDEEEFADGLCCLAVPLHGGAAPYAISVSAPAERFRRGRERYLEAARAAAAAATRVA